MKHPSNHHHHLRNRRPTVTRRLQTENAVVPSPAPVETADPTGTTAALVDENAPVAATVETCSDATTCPACASAAVDVESIDLDGATTCRWTLDDTGVMGCTTVNKEEVADTVLWDEMCRTTDRTNSSDPADVVGSPPKACVGATNCTACQMASISVEAEPESADTCQWTMTNSSNVDGSAVGQCIVAPKMVQGANDTAAAVVNWEDICAFASQPQVTLPTDANACAGATNCTSCQAASITVESESASNETCAWKDSDTVVGSKECVVVVKNEQVSNNQTLNSTGNWDDVCKDETPREPTNTNTCVKATNCTACQAASISVEAESASLDTCTWTSTNNNNGMVAKQCIVVQNVQEPNGTAAAVTWDEICAASEPQSPMGANACTKATNCTSCQTASISAESESDSSKACAWKDSDSVVGHKECVVVVINEASNETENSDSTVNWDEVCKHETQQATDATACVKATNCTACQAASISVEAESVSTDTCAWLTDSTSGTKECIVVPNNVNATAVNWDEVCTGKDVAPSPDTSACATATKCSDCKAASLLVEAESESLNSCLWKDNIAGPALPTAGKMCVTTTRDFVNNTPVVPTVNWEEVCQDETIPVLPEGSGSNETENPVPNPNNTSITPAPTEASVPAPAPPTEESLCQQATNCSACESAAVEIQTASIGDGKTCRWEAMSRDIGEEKCVVVDKSSEGGVIWNEICQSDNFNNDVDNTDNGDDALLGLFDNDNLKTDDDDNFNDDQTVVLNDDGVAPMNGDNDGLINENPGGGVGEGLGLTDDYVMSASDEWHNTPFAILFVGLSLVIGFLVYRRAFRNPSSSPRGGYSRLPGHGHRMYK